MNGQIEVQQLRFGITNGKRQKQGTVKIRLYISKPLLKYVESTTKDNQTKSQRFCELIEKGLRGDTQRPK